MCMNPIHRKRPLFCWASCALRPRTKEVQIVRIRKPHPLHQQQEGSGDVASAVEGTWTTAEQQLREYLDYFQLDKGYMLSFNFNKNKKQGVEQVQVGDKILIEAML